MSVMHEATDTIEGTARAALVPRPGWTVAALLTADVASLAIAAAAAVALAHTVGVATGPTPLLAWIPVTLLPTFAFAIAGLYPATGLGPVAEYRRLARALLATGGVSWMTVALVRGPEHLPVVLLACTALALATVPLGRAVARELGAHAPWWGAPVVLRGHGDAVAAAILQLQNAPRLGMRPVACVIEGSRVKPMHVLGVPVAGTIDTSMMPDDARVHPDLLVLPGTATPSADASHDARAHEAPAYVVPSDLPSLPVTGFVSTTLARALEQRGVRTDRRRPAQGAVKRGLDVLLALPFSVATLPIILFAALAVMLASPGTPFYYQVRAGLGGRPIRVWKLRTMYVDAAARLEQHLANDPAAQQEWSRSFKLTRDPRILPFVGRFLRTSSIDELPQVFNVLLGDMSFVGPRPFPEYHLQAFDDEFRTLRTTVRPGITGLWQVSARSDGDLAAQRALDTTYIENWSLGLDLYLLARTPVAVLTARGAR